MGKRRKGDDAPATGAWADKSPQGKADAFDASYEAHSGRGVPPLPDTPDSYGGNAGIPSSGPSVPDET